jgi:hypothetical protein
MASEEHKQQFSRIDLLFEKLNELRQQIVDEILLDPMLEKIIICLKEQPNATQEEVKSKLVKTWPKDLLKHHAFASAWAQLEEHGVIIPVSHGRGYARTWILSIKEA